MNSSSGKPLGGYWYYVIDEQLEAYAALPLLERLKWVEDARWFTLMARTQETGGRQERLRRGERMIVPGRRIGIGRRRHPAVSGRSALQYREMAR